MDWPEIARGRTRRYCHSSRHPPAAIASWQQAIFGYTLPALIGNIIGGVSLVTAINHAQVVS